MKSILSLFALLAVMHSNAQAVDTIMAKGKMIFQNNCTRCHGKDGLAGRFGAKNLQKSKLNDKQLFNIISNGRWLMPKWEKVLNDGQISAVILYVKTLKLE
jgi:mono/diheme cytochrome c family protein